MPNLVFYGLTPWWAARTRHDNKHPGDGSVFMHLSGLFFIIVIVISFAPGTGGSEVINLSMWWNGINNGAKDKQWDQNKNKYHLSLSCKVCLNGNNASDDIYITKAYLITEVHNTPFGCHRWLNNRQPHTRVFPLIYSFEMSNMKQPQIWV